MMTTRSERRVAGAVAFALWLLGASAPPASAQERRQALVEFTGGWVGFPDDGLENEALVGGALGWFVSPWLSLGPEVSLVQGNDHRHVLLTGNLTVHLTAPDARRLAPYVVVAGGLFQSHFERPEESVTTRDGTVAFGAGLRGAVSRRVTLGMEVRAGWPAHLRVTGAVGVVLGTVGPRRVTTVEREHTNGR